MLSRHFNLAVNSGQDECGGLAENPLKGATSESLAKTSDNSPDDSSAAATEILAIAISHGSDFVLTKYQATVLTPTRSATDVEPQKSFTTRSLQLIRNSLLLLPNKVIIF